MALIKKSASAKGTHVANIVAGEYNGKPQIEISGLAGNGGNFATVSADDMLEYCKSLPKGSTFAITMWGNELRKKGVKASGTAPEVKPRE